MKRSNTAIEEFIANYGCDGNNATSVLSDFFEIEEDNNDECGVTTSFPHYYERDNGNPSPPKKSRLQIVNSHRDAPFMKLLAGARGVDTETLYEHEDVDRVIQSDYETQMAEKQRLLAQENRTKKANQLKTRALELKNQLVNEREKDRLSNAYERLRELDDLVVGDETEEVTTYRYERMASTLNDYDIVLSEKPDPVALTAFMERSYLERDIHDENGPISFATQFKETGYGTDALKKIAMETLWYRDLDEDAVPRPDYVDFIREKYEEEESKAEQIKQQIGDIKREVEVKIEPKVFYQGMLLASPVNNRGFSPKHESYASFMTALIDARDDVIERNNLLKGINLNTIHVPELNERIQAIKNVNVVGVIDESKAYFKEVYHMNANPISLYTDLVKTADARNVTYKKQLGRYRETLRESSLVYEKKIEPILSDLSMTIAGENDIGDIEGGTQSLLLNTKKLTLYRDRIKKGTLSRDEIISNLITDPLFMTYYMTKLPKNKLVNKRLDSYLALSLLFLSLDAYVPSHDAKILSEIVSTEKALAQIEEDDNAMVIHTMHHTIGDHIQHPPPHCGAQVRPDVEEKIDEAYQLVKDYCIGLKGLPLCEFKTKQSIEVGLGGDFARYVASLFADGNLLNPDRYNTTNAYQKVTLRKSEMMNRLQKYSYMKRQGMGSDCYLIQKDDINNSRRG